MWLASRRLRSFLRATAPDLYSALITSNGGALFETHDEEFLELLINKAPDKEWMEFLYVSLCVAARADNVDVFHKLFALCKNSPGLWTKSEQVKQYCLQSMAENNRIVRLLNHTATGGSAEVLPALLKVDCFLSAVRDARDGVYGQSALFCAAREGFLRCVVLLIKAGAPLEYRQALGGTALTAAVQSGHECVVLQLLAAGADVQTTTHQSRAVAKSNLTGTYTPLGFAAARNNESIVGVLVEAGAVFGENRAETLCRP